MKFSTILAITAMMIAGCAAYYSVFGLSQLFAGASLAVIIMASVLEISKIVAVSFLQRYWNKVAKGLMTYLCVGVIVLMTITSAGIYGFLSNAYQKTAVKSEIFDGQMSVLTTKQQSFEKTLADNNKIIDTKTKRLNQLTDLRTSQESRLDLAVSSSDKRRARSDIDLATKEIQNLSSDIDSFNVKNVVTNDSISAYESKGLDTKSSSHVAGDLGPLKFLAELTGRPMSVVVNWFILLLIFVFDPLAIALVIATNKVMELEKNDDKKVVLPEELNEINNLNEEVDDKEDVEYVPRNGEGQRSDYIYEVDNRAELEARDTLRETINNLPTFDDNYAFVYNEQNEQNNDITIDDVVEKMEDEDVQSTEVEADPENFVTDNRADFLNNIIGKSNEVVVKPEQIIELVPETETKQHSPVVANGKIEREDIKEIKEGRGYSVAVPHPKVKNNEIERFQ